MTIKYFGQYLLEKGVITPAALIEAVDLQQSTNKSLGSLAVELGYINEEQASRINIEQRNKDLLFGEIAVEQGLMNHDQVEHTLEHQRQTHLHLGQALIKIKACSNEQIETHLATFKQDQALYQDNRVRLPKATPKPKFVTECIDITAKMLLRMACLQTKIGKIELLDQSEVSSYLLNVCIPFSGDIQSDYALSTNAETARVLASKLFDTELDTADEFAQDALFELCNTIAGNICTQCELRGLQLSIGLPQARAANRNDDLSTVVASLHIPEGLFELCISVTHCPDDT